LTAEVLLQALMRPDVLERTRGFSPSAPIVNELPDLGAAARRSQQLERVLGSEFGIDANRLVGGAVVRPQQLIS
jgi:hypothetical protein